VVSRPIFDEESKNALEIAVRAVLRPRLAWAALYIHLLSIHYMSLHMKSANRARTPYEYGIIPGGAVLRPFFNVEFENALGIAVRTVIGPPLARRCARVA
jgi:hypothetical protein